MDTAIYIGTVLLTVAWSVWIYLLWGDRASLPEDSGFRFLLIVGPSSFFLLIALSGWGTRLLFRIDLFGLIALNGTTLLCVLVLIVVFSVERISSKTGYATVLFFYYLIATSITVAAHVLKLFPTAVMRIALLISQGLQLEFLSFAWVGVNPLTHEVDLVSMLNKILIALLSYVPVSVVRFVYWNRQRKRTERQIEDLKRKVEELSERIR